jgi:alkanesulfonate monooxygenase SsuD/methylene tetrahydromethanopterin reductase-like flavin-dependent oxidoreductase (luciferase family)
MPGIAPILASTEAEARRKEDEFFELVHPNIQLALLSDQFGLDFSAYRLDEPLPMADILKAPRVLSGARDPSRLIAEVAGRIPTLGEYLRQISRVRAHLSFVGTPDQLADRMADWFEDGACDGFNLMPPVIPGELDILVDELVPALRARGLFRQDYTAQTLRGHLGLPRGRP